MTELTDNFGLSKPARNSRDWDGLINQNFDDIDTLIKDLSDDIVGIDNKARLSLPVSYIPVANNSSWPTATTQANDGGHFVRKALRITNDVETGLFEWQNTRISNADPAEINGNTAILMRASLEIGGGTFRYISGSTAYNAGTTYAANDQVSSGGISYCSLQSGNVGHTPSSNPTWWRRVRYIPLHFAGEDSSRTITIQPGQKVRCLPVGGLGLVKGDRCHVNVWVTTTGNNASGTQTYPTAMTTRTEALCDYNVTTTAGNAPPDYTTVMPTTEASTAARTVFTPITFLGVPNAGIENTVTFGILGDSIPNGTGDTWFDTNETASWIIRALNNDYSVLRCTKSADRAQYVVADGRSRLLSLDVASHFIGTLSVNDLQAGRTFAEIQADVLWIINRAAAKGQKVIWTTCTPVTTSTDSWTTTGNQTPASGFGAGSHWLNFNNWIKTVPAPLSGIIDVAGVVCDNANSNVWKANYTSDGIHPNATAHLAIAAAVNVASLL